MNKQKKTVRLVDIAKECGVSHSTVSRALKGHPGIPEKTKDKVRTVAERLGYRPDPRMNELMAQVRKGRELSGTHNLALVYLSGTVASEQAKNHIGAYARGVKERTEALGYGLIETSVSERRNLDRLFRDTGVTGVILASPSDVRVDLKIEWERTAWAAVGFIPEWPTVHAAIPDFADASQRCVADLVSKGLKRLGFVNDPQVDSWLGRAWLGGFMAECVARNVEPCVVTLEKEAYYRLPKAWKKLPDALVLHDGQVEEILQAECGWDRPVRYLNIFGETEPKSGILPADWESGINAVDLVVGQLRRGERGIPGFQKKITVCGKWKK